MSKQSERTPFWHQAIAEAEARQAKGLVPFTDEQIGLSEDWVTCACGKQDDFIPRRSEIGTFSYGSPIDAILYSLGVSFMKSAIGQDPAAAKATLHAIEARVMELAKELQAEGEKT